MRYTAVLLTFSSVAFAAPMESGTSLRMTGMANIFPIPFAFPHSAQLKGKSPNKKTNKILMQVPPLPCGAPNNGSTGGILSGLTGLLGSPGSQLPGSGNQNAPNNGGTGGVLSGLTSLLGNPGSQHPANSNPNAHSSGAAAGGGSIMSGITSLLSNLGSHLPGNGDQYPPNSGGTGGLMADLQVLPDHMKFVTIPSTAEQPIPKEQNSQMREGHRIVHVAINKSLGADDAKNSTESQL
ncbi:hypothetical protein G3M48_004097 [Beauveria asiatica]|uniref:Uncharacterized protein n=1 Tax=Beauveria asiatica TaxID=1069075 RepID=A0AAW0RTX4_9HYPO